MDENVNKDTTSKTGDVEMGAAVKKLDFDLSTLIKKNYEKIKASTPINPSISADDEWRNEDNWDELYKELNK